MLPNTYWVGLACCTAGPYAGGDGDVTFVNLGGVSTQQLAAQQPASRHGISGPMEIAYLIFNDGVCIRAALRDTFSLLFNGC